ncbi:MAG: agmatine deiminase family protein [Opitutales bacterium]|nr:agmatine deiminase family protein [Opitutales bacterium]
MSWPAEDGFYFPAEWERQRGVWLSWPHHPDTWADCREEVLRDYAAFIASLSHFTKVFLNHPPGQEGIIEATLTKARAKLTEISLFSHLTDDAWCRDHGPIFLKNLSTGEIAITDWEFNAWGGKFPSSHDNLIPSKIASATGYRHYRMPYILEGGSIDTDGQGTLLTTRSCLLNPNRNQGLAPDEIESVLRRGLGIRNIWWLEEGLEGDDTDGHIDDITRFAPDGIILTAWEEDPQDPNHQALANNYRQLENWVQKDPRPREIVRLPMPARLDYQGQRLPASYANFLVVNGAVLMPSFAQPEKDQAAEKILQKSFPNRQIVPVDSRIFVRESGALHCLSQQEPSTGKD